MKAKIIAVANHKGIVGKPTSVAPIAAILGRCGNIVPEKADVMSNHGHLMINKFYITMQILNPGIY